MTASRSLDFFATLSVEQVQEHQCRKAAAYFASYLLVQVDHRKIKPRVTRSLPAHPEKRFGVVPFGVNVGRLLVATQRVPAPEALNEIKSYTRLLVEPQLVTREIMKHCAGLCIHEWGEWRRGPASYRHSNEQF